MSWNPQNRLNSVGHITKTILKQLGKLHTHMLCYTCTNNQPIWRYCANWPCLFDMEWPWYEFSCSFSYLWKYNNCIVSAIGAPAKLKILFITTLFKLSNKCIELFLIYLIFKWKSKKSKHKKRPSKSRLISLKSIILKAIHTCHISEKYAYTNEFLKNMSNEIFVLFIICKVVIMTQYLKKRICWDIKDSWFNLL